MINLSQWSSGEFCLVFPPLDNVKSIAYEYKAIFIPFVFLFPSRQQRISLKLLVALASGVTLGLSPAEMSFSSHNSMPSTVLHASTLLVMAPNATGFLYIYPKVAAGRGWSRAWVCFMMRYRRTLASDQD